MKFFPSHFSPAVFITTSLSFLGNFMGSLSQELTSDESTNPMDETSEVTFKTIAIATGSIIGVIAITCCACSCYIKNINKSNLPRYADGNVNASSDEESDYMNSDNTEVSGYKSGGWGTFS